MWRILIRGLWGPSFPSLSCAANCKCPKVADVTPRYSDQRSCCSWQNVHLSPTEGRGQAGSPSVTRHCPKCPSGPPAHTFKGRSAQAFPPGRPGRWKALLSVLLSAHIASGVWGTQISGLSFGFIDPGHGTKHLPPGDALGDLLARTLSLKPGGLLCFRCCLEMGTLPRSAGVGSGVVFKSCFYLNCSGVFIQLS